MKERVRERWIRKGEEEVRQSYNNESESPKLLLTYLATHNDCFKYP